MKIICSSIIGLMIIVIAGCGDIRPIEFEEVCSSNSSQWQLIESFSGVYDGEYFNNSLWVVSGQNIIEYNLTSQKVFLHRGINCDYLLGTIRSVEVYMDAIYFSGYGGLAILSSDNQWSTIGFDNQFPFQDIYDMEVVNNHLWIAGANGIIKMDETQSWQFVDIQDEMSGEKVVNLSIFYDGVHIESVVGERTEKFQRIHRLYDGEEAVILDEPYQDYLIVNDELSYKILDDGFFESNDKGKSWRLNYELSIYSDLFINTSNEQVYLYADSVIYEVSYGVLKPILDLTDLNPGIKQFNAIAIDENLRIFVIDDYGVNIFSNGIWGKKRIKNSQYVSEIAVFSNYIYTNEYIYDLKNEEIVERINNLVPDSLIAGEGGKVYFLEIGNRMVMYQNGTQVSMVDISDNIVSGFSVIDKAVDQNGNYWVLISTFKEHILRISETEVEKVPIPEEMKGNYALNITFDTSNRLWIYSRNKGVFVLVSDGVWEEYKFENQNISQLDQIAFSEDDHMWVLVGSNLLHYHENVFIADYSPLETGHLYWDELYIQTNQLPCLIGSDFTVSCMSSIE